jgi:hypothetical protein
MPGILISHASFPPLHPYRSCSSFRLGENRRDELAAGILTIRRWNAKSE